MATKRLIRFSNVGHYNSSLVTCVNVFHSNENGSYISLLSPRMLGYGSGPTVDTYFYFLKTDGTVAYVDQSWDTSSEKVSSMKHSLEEGVDLRVKIYSDPPTWETYRSNFEFNESRAKNYYSDDEEDAKAEYPDERDSKSDC